VSDNSKLGDCAGYDGDTVKEARGGDFSDVYHMEWHTDFGILKSTKIRWC
jgi:hypothetical protein